MGVALTGSVCLDRIIQVSHPTTADMNRIRSTKVFLGAAVPQSQCQARSQCQSGSASFLHDSSVEEKDPILAIKESSKNEGVAMDETLLYPR